MSERERNFLMIKLCRHVFEKTQHFVLEISLLGLRTATELTHPSSQKFFYTSSSTKFNQYQPTSSIETMDTDIVICVHYVFSAGKQIKLLGSSFPWCFFLTIFDNDSTNIFYLIQTNMYLVQVSYMFQPYLVITRLA